ncbi:MAG: exodeoxyribonuclease VII large subunit [Pseudomonadales bacterium]|nr:exodeoxyribonuclease VII large subunit [Pseudomonadales bacterium]
MREKIILSVGQLARSARQILEKNFSQVWVEGELSNFARPQSGHWYFTLKDKSAQLRCAMFAGRNRSVKFKPQDGLKVLLRGKVSLYEGRGDFQIIVDRLEPAGEGALRLAFEQLKNQLEQEGLFAQERKRILPVYPRHLAIISSGTGAAYQDVLSVIQRRYPSVQISLMPVAVQGPDSESQVLKALSILYRWVVDSQPPPDLQNSNPPDLLLLTRGGGSLEDLWTFNLETVARELANCAIPAVSAIGHETDFTITDFVADLRAPTPSAAAEIITPDASELIRHFARIEQSLRSQIRRSLIFHQQQLQILNKQLVHPGQKLQQQMQALDDASQRLDKSFVHALAQMKNTLTQAKTRLLAYNPQKELQHARSELRHLHERLLQEMQYALQNANARVMAGSRALHTVSPLETLARGYSIVTRPNDVDDSPWRAAIKSVQNVAPGEVVNTHFIDGHISSVVQSISPLENDKSD